MYNLDLIQNNRTCFSYFSTAILSLLLVSSLTIANVSYAQNTEVVNERQPGFDSIATDFQQQLNVLSGDQKLDGKSKTSIFIDDVVITQGSLEIRADRVEADASQGNGNEMITAIGQPAVYKQRLEDGSFVSAQANEIIYNVSTKTISLKGNAEITQNQSKVSADAISYDMLNEKINASRNENSDGRVNTVISFGDNANGDGDSGNDSNKEQDGGE